MNKHQFTSVILALSALALLWMVFEYSHPAPAVVCARIPVNGDCGSDTDCIQKFGIRE